MDPFTQALANAEAEEIVAFIFLILVLVWGIYSIFFRRRVRMRRQQRRNDFEYQQMKHSPATQKTQKLSDIYGNGANVSTGQRPSAGTVQAFPAQPESVTKRFCGYCGAELSDSDRFCSACGAANGAGDASK